MYGNSWRPSIRQRMGDEVGIGHRYRDYEKLFIVRWEKFSEGEPRSVLCNVAMGLQYIHRKQLGHLNATSKNKTVDG